MSVERHRQREQSHLETLLVQDNKGCAKIDWDLLIHDVAPPQIEVPIGGFIFSREVMYHPS